MKTLRGVFAIGGAAVFVSVTGFALAIHGRAQTADHTAINGAWTLNTDLSDAPPAAGEGQNGDRPNNGGGRSGGGMGGGMGGGRHGGGMGRGGGMGGGNGASSMSPEDAARRRDAIHDVMTAPAHLTVTQTDTMVLVTSQDGRTSRLAPDGSKVKDDSTHMERKTKWDGAKLVSEINGLGPGKITETYAVDAEHHQLHVTVQTEGGHNRKPMTLNRVYDLDPR
ncbi:MAG TPA: hypothetical protein VG222_10950 [Vicinamibacterales bacterium]|jgi:hypothetical protein|nr:hypothetical protein [Vicinamibacterales bacterium]